MPQLGESVVEGTVSRWLKQVGDSIKQYEPILEVTTDKVNTEIPSPASGTLLEIVVPEGMTVKAGTVIALIGEGEPSGAPVPLPARDDSKRTTAPLEAPQPPIYVSTSGSTVPRSAPKPNGSARGRLTPVVARMISEYKISEAELASIQGTGENGRISKKDIESFLETRPNAGTASMVPPWEQPGTGELFRPTEEVFAKTGSGPATILPLPLTDAAPPTSAQSESAPGAQPEVIPLSPIRRAIAEHMVRSKAVAPHVTTVHEADVSRVLAHFAGHQEEFARQGARLTYTPYFVQAIVYGLQKIPIVNAQFTPNGILMNKVLNIGVAVATDDGLIVPVIKHADDKSLLGLARAINDLSQRAREKKLAPGDVAGGTFTLTNYGVFGSLFGTPVIAQPQSAILGVGAIQKRAVVLNDAIAIRPMVYLSLSFDHRLLDGALGDGFMTQVKQFLESYPE
jgi:2-oxoglutarate dehydrogenase E2 component (dihydrolipoamide succinyltransferase)